MSQRAVFFNQLAQIKPGHFITIEPFKHANVYLYQFNQEHGTTITSKKINGLLHVSNQAATTLPTIEQKSIREQNLSHVATTDARLHITSALEQLKPGMTTLLTNPTHIRFAELFTAKYNKKYKARCRVIYTDDGVLLARSDN